MSGTRGVEARWPVSVKGVLVVGGGVVVVRNHRDEYELPGGRLEADDPSPEATLRREMREELGIEVDVGDPIDSWLYDVAGRRVLILTYRCVAAVDVTEDDLVISHEHVGVAVLDLRALRAAAIPDGYVRSVERVFGSRGRRSGALSRGRRSSPSQ